MRKGRDNMPALKRKQRNPLIPIYLFLTTYVLVQLYNYSFTLFGFVLAALLSSIGLVKLLKTSKWVSQHLSTELLNIDELPEREFQQMLVPLFQKQGYSVSKTKGNRKLQPDLILRKKGLKAIVVAKRQQNQVGSSFVHDVIALNPLYQAKRTIIVTNSHYTKAAKRVARANKVILIDRDLLDAMLDSYLEQKRTHRIIQRVRTLLVKQEVKGDPQQ
ncbi:restriction endonuclease [Alkalihalobacillus sp. MEB130]|uniref:restriction endonuclease n=1 Tax=Alkalihalobacillus sp. MEB130 TaxID=2976704 RepID=UPI0028DF0381|nr:restriction endonuclease [Alkalihalobacillus sp. MEB130]MDT8862983.1 restriction endonuclease [Alkalihalobacillus sp. MEB130]